MAYDSAALEALGIYPGGGGTYVDRSGNPVDPSMLGDAVKQKAEGWTPSNIAVNQYNEPNPGWQQLGMIQGNGPPMPYYYNAGTGQVIGYDGSTYGNGSLQDALQGVGNSNYEVANRAAQSAAGRSGWDEPDNLATLALKAGISSILGPAAGQIVGAAGLTGLPAAAASGGLKGLVTSGGNLSAALSGAAMGGLNSAGSSLFGNSSASSPTYTANGGNIGADGALTTTTTPAGGGMDEDFGFTPNPNSDGSYYTPPANSWDAAYTALGGQLDPSQGNDIFSANGNGLSAAGSGGLFGASNVASLLKALGLGGGAAGAGGNSGGLFGLGTGAGSTGGQLGSILASVLGYNAANNQTAAYKSLADQYAGYGAPYRQQLSDLMANPSSFLSSDQVQKPVQMGSDMLARSLSMQGNPVTSGNALLQLQNYSTNQLYSQLQWKENQLGQLGGIANFNQAAPTAASSAIQSSGNAANAIGSGISNIFMPQQSLAQQLAAFTNGGVQQ